MLLSNFDLPSTAPYFSFGDWDIVAARVSTDPGTMNRFPTNKFTSATASDGTLQALIRELIITSGTGHASSTYYSSNGI